MTTAKDYEALNSRQRLRSVWLTLALGLVSVSTFADHSVYRWLDSADGAVHYADIEPQNRPYDLIVIQHDVPPVDPEVQRRLAEMNQLIIEWIEERDQQAAVLQSEARLEASRNEGCARASEQRSKLETVPVSRLLIPDAEGNQLRMTEAERQERLSAAIQQISELCPTGQ